MSREETTNWFGNYVMKFDGSPDLSGCYAQVSGSGQGSTSCGAAAGPAQNLRLMFRMFDMEMYTVDPLLTQPAQPMSFCPRSTNPVPAPVTPVVSPLPFKLPPMPRLPPMPPLPPLPPMPPLPPLSRVESNRLKILSTWTRTNLKLKIKFQLNPIQPTNLQNQIKVRIWLDFVSWSA